MFDDDVNEIKLFVSNSDSEIGALNACMTYWYMLITNFGKLVLLYTLLLKGG
jgi:hypothetical protein